MEYHMLYAKSRKSFVVRREFFYFAVCLNKTHGKACLYRVSEKSTWCVIFLWCVHTAKSFFLPCARQKAHGKLPDTWQICIFPQCTIKLGLTRSPTLQERFPCVTIICQILLRYEARAMGISLSVTDTFLSVIHYYKKYLQQRLNIFLRQTKISPVPKMVRGYCNNLATPKNPLQGWLIPQPPLQKDAICRNGWG